MGDPALEIIMEAGWIGCIRWAIGEPDVVDRFERETGHRLVAVSKRSGIERLVDEATGYRDATLEAFVEWVTVEIWGEEDAPAKYREELRRKREQRAGCGRSAP